MQWTIIPTAIGRKNKKRRRLPMPDNIPAIPMVSILRRYAYENKLPWDGRWETIVRVFNHYSLTAKYLN